VPTKDADGDSFRYYPGFALPARDLLPGPDPAVERYEAQVSALDARQALQEDTEPARRLRGLIDPSQLKPRIELEVVRWTRIGSSGWFRKNGKAPSHVAQ